MINRIMIATLAVLSPVALVAQERAPVQPQVEVWLNDNGTFEQGDRMRVFFRTDMDAYVTVVRVTTEGHVRILFPETPIENNYVAGDAEYEIVQYGREEYRVHDDPGHGYVFAVASTVPFDYTAFSAGAAWDYHLLAFEGEEERDPYDTFAHFMDDILAQNTQEFAYQAASYSVDQRGSQYYRSTYRYYAVPYYHGCHVYRAFWGLRSYYVYDYDCASFGVQIILGSRGHYYHDDYYHYGYRGYNTYYYGAGSVYRYRYVGGGYRHDHGARRVSRAVYSGLGRHSERNPRATDGGGRTIDRGVSTPTSRRTSAAGSPVRTSPTPRRVGALSPQGASSNRRVATPTTRQPSQSSAGRRTTTTVSPGGQAPSSPTPRSTSGGLTRRQGGSTSGTTSSANPQRRETESQPSSGGTVARPSQTRRTPGAGTSTSPSTTRRVPSPTPRSAPTATPRTPSASPRSTPSTTRRTPSASPRSTPSTTRRTPSASPRSTPSTTRRTPSASPPRSSAPRSAPRTSSPSSGSRSTGSSPARSTGSSAPRSSGRSPSSTSRRRPGN